MTMLETTVEDICFVFGKNNDGRTRKSAVVYPISKANIPKSMSQPHLWLGIEGVYCGHSLRDLPIICQIHYKL